jgi:ABC-type cobalamin transport system permease subunit
MKQLAGAIVVLAGAALMGAGIMANALLEAANRLGEPGTGIAVLGAIVGIVGFVGYFRGDRPEPPARSEA